MLSVVLLELGTHAPLATALGLAVVLTLVAGLAASAQALRQRPIEALRDEPALAAKLEKEAR